MLSELRVSDVAARIFAGDFDGDGNDELAVYGDRDISLHTRIGVSGDWRGMVVRLGHPIAMARAAPCNADKLSDLVVLTDGPPLLEVLVRNRDGGFAAVWESPVSSSSLNCITADINNDHRTDVLLFGKKQPGITVWAGKGNGTFRRGEVLLPEYSYSTVSIVDVNEDGVNDIIATNWLSNALLVFTGFGRMKFSEPVELQFTHEPSLVAVGRFDSDYNPDLAVGFPEDSVYRIMLGDGLGEFHEVQTVRSGGTLASIAVADINGDGRDDVCFLNPAARTWVVDMNDGTGKMQDRVTFFAGESPVAATLVWNAGSSYPDAAILDRGSSSLRVLRNANLTTPTHSEMTLAAGLRPEGIIVTDIDRDGWDDILVANGGSHEVSLFLNQSHGLIKGMIPLPASMASSALRLCGNNDTSSVFVGTSDNMDSISILSVDLPRYSSSSFSLPSQGLPEILDVTVDRVTSYLRILVLEHERAANTASLSEFEQVSSARFVERTVVHSTEQPLLAAAISDIRDKNPPRLILATCDKNGHSVNLRAAIRAEGGQYEIGKLLCSFDQSCLAAPQMWSTDFNNDRIPDLIMYFGDPENSLLLFQGRQDSTISQPTYLLRHSIAVTKAAELQFFDMNSDGIPDLVCQNDMHKAIELYLGNRDGTLMPPTRLAVSEGSGGFAICRLSHDPIPELIMTDKMHGTLKIITLKEQ